MWRIVFAPCPVVAIRLRNSRRRLISRCSARCSPAPLAWVPAPKGAAPLRRGSEIPDAGVAGASRPVPGSDGISGGDRLSWMRFCGLGSGDAVPDANTLWDFREALIRAKALDGLFARLDQAISEAGYLPMSGQIVDATLVAAPRQRNTDEEKAAIKAGRSADEIWPDEPAKTAQKDTDARWTVKFSKAKPTMDGKPQVDIAIPTFGDKVHISIDRRHGVIRRRIVTDAAAHDGARLHEGLIDPNNTPCDVWADTAYRSQAHEDHLAGLCCKVWMNAPEGGRRHYVGDHAAWGSICVVTKSTASANALGPMPKARSIRRASPRMSRVILKGAACPLRSARITSNPLIVA
jgi:IS5 family transposase